ncbi:MAG: hypothetical protein V1726_01820 [Methanobacteriota archaeon]
MKFEKKGILGPFTIFTSFITGAIFPLIGSLVALNTGVVHSLYLEGVALVMIGGFLAHWILAHTVHDLVHLDIEKRDTFSKTTLKILFGVSAVILLSIAVYLTWQRGWPVMVFAVIGFVVSLYAEGLIHHESQMAFGAMFLVIGAFYVQTATLLLDSRIWIKVLCIALFAFFSQYGWLLFYRLDDYQWDVKVKNRSIIIAKIGLFFLVVYLFL